MPWKPSDAQRHDKKAKSAVAKRQWADVADSVLAKTGDEGRAVREANGAVAKRRITSAAASKIMARVSKTLGCFLLFIATAWAGPKTFQVTIGASATQLSANNLYCSAWIIQNNAAHNVAFGDSTVTITNGIILASGTPGGAYTTTASMNGSQPAPDNLSEWYVAGTNGDVVNVVCKQVNF